MNLNYKTAGWTVTRKLVYYVISLIVIMQLFYWASALMTIASTFAFLGGAVLAVITVGLAFTFIIREVLWYCNKFGKSEQ